MLLFLRTQILSQIFIIIFIYKFINVSEQLKQRGD